jgi:hypothetical protein
VAASLEKMKSVLGSSRQLAAPCTSSARGDLTPHAHTIRLETTDRSFSLVTNDRAFYGQTDLPLVHPCYQISVGSSSTYSPGAWSVDGWSTGRHRRRTEALDKLMVLRAWTARRLVN